MATDIKCPKCGFGFPIEQAVSEDYKRGLREEMIAFKKQKEDELLKEKEELARRARDMQQSLEKQEQEYSRKLREEKQRLQQTIEENIRKTIASDYEIQLKMLREANRENEEKLGLARKKELEFLQKEQALMNREAELELLVQRQLQEERGKLMDELRKLEDQKSATKERDYQLKLKELEKQLDDQRQLAEEMRRKAEQGSVQLHGEVQELLLEEILREHFPFDSIQEVGKGSEGADCIQVVRDPNGRECGKIIFESKRTRVWQNAWISKLKNDMRTRQADLSILVTQTFPKDMKCFGEREGVWVCSFGEVISLATALRNAILRISETQRSEENKDQKMALLYKYLTGVEFRQQIEAIVEGFMAMKNSITRERIQMEKLWKEREKQLEKVLLNTSGLYGSIKGIAGASVNSIPLLENEIEQEPEDDMAH